MSTIERRVRPENLHPAGDRALSKDQAHCQPKVKAIRDRRITRRVCKPVDQLDISQASPLRLQRSASANSECH
jgi:hypothetical protein